ncbi:nitroreductase/quinone reductase family protein [Streptomyces sp. HUAS TT3]|uniref:nitroreductase/quinone reductase family protein n=1 Tax=Streptomyces sp. HUAS TT3 TaxID=3447510 RepID=UPI003F6593EF
MYRALGGRAGLWRPRARGRGALRLTTTGRRTGRRRSVIIAYLEDASNLVAPAMNGRGAGEPAWWLNLRTHPGPPSTWPTDSGRSGAGPQPATSGRGSGPAGGRSTRTWTPTRH